MRKKKKKFPILKEWNNILKNQLRLNKSLNTLFSNELKQKNILLDEKNINKYKITDNRIQLNLLKKK